MQHKNILTCRAERQSSAKQKLFRHLFGIVGGSALLIGFGTTHAETFTLEEATIDQIQKAMADGALTSVELTSMYLNRIAIYDQNGIKLNSVIQINPDAFSEAKAADDKRKAGTATPLTGITYLPKMNHAVEGLTLDLDLVAAAGVKAKKNAWNVKNMRAAGAVVIGLANMDQYFVEDYAVPTNHGFTLNPYGLDLENGDSSSGSGTAIAANLTVVSTGGDTGASNRVNSQLSAISTMRYTWGAVSTEGIAPITSMKDEPAPMARTIKDLTVVMNTLAGENPNDLLQRYLRFPDYRQIPSYSSEIKPNALAGARIGIINDTEYQTSSPSVKALFLAAVEKLRALGAEVVEVSEFKPRSTWEPMLEIDPGPAAFYHAWNGVEYASILYAYESFVTGFMDTAKTFTEIYAPTFTGFLVEGDFAADPKLFAANPPGQNPFDAQAVAKRNQVRLDFEQWLVANDLDAAIHPIFAQEARPMGQWLVGDFVISYFQTASYIGLPTADVFAGFAGSSIPGLGLEFIGAAYSDAKLLGYASAYEEATKLRRAPALTPPLPGETIEYSTALPPPSRPELNAPALRVAAGAKVAGKGKKATLVLTGVAVDASGLAALTVYVNGKKIAAKKAKNWKATIRLAALRSFVKGSAKTVQVTVVAKDVYGNTSVTTKTVKLPKTA